MAVAGCAGTNLEQLVVITSLGRRWAPPMSRSSLCTAPFYEAAPPGGVLMGLQVRVSPGRGAQGRGREASKGPTCMGRAALRIQPPRCWR